MTNCFWKKCDCPSSTPCTQHAGIQCSSVGGRTITAESQINDAVTSALQAAVADLDRDEQTLQRLRVELERQKADLERELQDFQQKIASARDRQARSQVFAEAQRANERYKVLKDHLSQTLNQIDDIALAPQRALSLFQNHLVVPFYDPTGYCACYQAKVGRLNALARLLATERATLASLMGQYATLAPALRLSLGALVFYGLILTIVVIGILWFGWGFTALLTPFIGSLGNLIAVIILTIRLNALALQIVASKRLIANLMLTYYRLQQIPTCRKEGDEDDETPWWTEFWGRF
jgi:hypothetical protein